MVATAAAAALAGCRGAPQTATVPPQQAQPLSGYLAQRIVITPVSRVRTDTMGWVQRLGGARPAGLKLDSALLLALEGRAIGGEWFKPADVTRSYERNRTYAVDPYNLATDPLRPATFTAASRYGEPLATQLRTMVALHEGARFVLLPVELRFDRDVAGTRAVLRTVIVDARSSEARWVGELRSDIAPDPAGALANVAQRFADLFIAP
jgi:hypothetical protein